MQILAMPYESTQFSRIRNHVWNTHSLEPGFHYVVFQVAHGATPTFKVSGDMLEINICGF